MDHTNLWKCTDPTGRMYAIVEADDLEAACNAAAAARRIGEHDTPGGHHAVTPVTSWLDIMPGGLDLGDDIGVPLVGMEEGHQVHGVYLGDASAVLLDYERAPESCFVHATLGDYDWRVALEQRLGFAWALQQLYKVRPGKVHILWDESDLLDITLRPQTITDIDRLDLALALFEQQGGTVLRRS